MILLSDPAGWHLIWEMTYTELSQQDIGALVSHFSSCVGPYHAFTFIDPADNMLSSSADFTAAVWQVPSWLQLSSGIADPFGGNGAFTITNTGQVTAQLSQFLLVPAGYQYCFSVYAMSSEASELAMVRQGPAAMQSDSGTIGPTWNRLISSGQLNDSGDGFTVSISLAPGQQIGIYGPQLEPQLAPSRYRRTVQAGGVYSNAHWGVDELPISADAPNLFSTSFTIEAPI